MCNYSLPRCANRALASAPNVSSVDVLLSPILYDHHNVFGLFFAHTKSKLSALNFPSWGQSDLLRYLSPLMFWSACYQPQLSVAIGIPHLVINHIFRVLLGISRLTAICSSLWFFTIRFLASSRISSLWSEVIRDMAYMQVCRNMIIAYMTYAYYSI